MMEKKNFESVMRNVEVLMLSKDVVDGREVRRIKTMTLSENVMNYLDVTSGEKVKELIKAKIKDSKVFGNYNVDDLWYKWDDFLDMWRKKRAALNKSKKKEAQDNENNNMTE